MQIDATLVGEFNMETEQTATEAELTALLFRARDESYLIEEDEYSSARRVRYILEKIIQSLSEGKELPRVRS